MKKMIYDLFMCACLLMISSTAWSDWQETLEVEFDHVETFDNLSDWTGSGYGDQTTGLPTGIDFYSYWNNTTVSERGTWIGNHGSAYDANGNGKSATISIIDGAEDSYDNKGEGPSRLGWYIGDGTASSGYSEIYVFARLYFPENFFPTSTVEDGGDTVGSYSSSSGYNEINGNAIWTKFLQVSTGMSAIDEYAGTSQGYPADVYGDAEVMTNIRTAYPLPTEAVKPHLYTFTSTYNYGPSTSADDVIPRSTLMNKLIAVQFRFKLETAPGDSDGEYEYWVYDSDGTQKFHHSSTNVRYRPVSGDSKYMGVVNTTHRFNKIVIGGNNSDLWDIYDSTMADHLWIDDVIFNDTPIAMKYFELIGASLSPPHNLEINTPN